MQYSMEFIGKLLNILDKHDMHGELFFRTGKKYGGGEYPSPAAFFINCSDIFYWGTADLEEITPENIDQLEQAFIDCKKADNLVGVVYAPILFAARMRKTRPQNAAYPEEKSLWPLFDAAGPKREIDLCNPRKRPGDEDVKKQN